MASNGSEKPGITDMSRIISNVDWFRLGLELKIPLSELTNIGRIDHRDSNGQRLAMLDLWLEYCPDASWNIFADALDRSGEHVQAATVRQDYCGGLAPVRPSLSAPGRDVEDDSNGTGSKAKEQPAEETNEEEIDGLSDIIPLMKHALFGKPKGPATDHTDGAMKQKVERFYKMDGQEKASHGRHGIALIINNIEWEKDENGVPYMKKRVGAKDGAAALKKSLEDIGYKVKVKENLTGDQMKEKLKKARELIDTADDSFICCISTHGDEDGVYGIDGRSRKRRQGNGDKHKPVSIEDLSKILEPDVCKKLSRKPKIFFIQACRGGTVSKPTDDPNEEEPPVPRINVVPRGADYYFSYATDPGHLALRKEYPDYLSQALKKKLSLDEIVMSVHERLASNVATVKNDEEHQQIGQVVHTMRGPVYF